MTQKPVINPQWHPSANGGHFNGACDDEPLVSQSRRESAYSVNRKSASNMAARKRSQTSGSVAENLYRRRGVLGAKDEVTSFWTKAYNPETQELWGRTAWRWGQLGLFYLCFYAGLAVFYMLLWFLWTKVILNLDSPEYSGPEDGLAWTPGVGFRPLLDKEKKSTLLRFTRSNDSQIAEIKDMTYWDFLEQYETKNWDSANGNFIDCTQGRTDPDVEKVCRFNLDWIRPCIYEDDYGWADGQPCIILKLNKVNNWVPEDYASIDEVPDEIKDIWEPGMITVKCMGEDPVSRELLGDIEYYPQPGWSFDYYPFTGQQGYKSPLVAAQFMSIPHRVAIFIVCRAYTKNMIYDKQYGLGEVRFEIISD